MKFMCLGYSQESKWEGMPPVEVEAMIEEGLAYVRELHEAGHWLEGGHGLLSSRLARSLRWKDGQVLVTDGPFSETKEQLAGTGMLEATDMAQAIALMARHPCLRHGPAFEIRPIDPEALERNRELDAQAGIGQAAGGNFVSLGYVSAASWQDRSPSDLAAMVQACTAFDQEMRRDGLWRGGIALAHPQTAKTMRWDGSKANVTDGPYTETKEWLGGLVILELEAIEQGVERLTGHPGLPFGIGIELRPIDQQLSDRWAARIGKGTATRG